MSMFGNLGEMAGLMKKFGEIQNNMKKMKEELPKIEVAGTDSLGKVEAKVSGDFCLRSIRISPDLAASADAEKLQSAIYEAVNQALILAKQKSAEKLSEATGGIPIPGLTE